MRLAIYAIAIVFVFVLGLVHAVPVAWADTVDDPRRLESGRPIPDEGYCDQPYLVILPGGDWLATLTTGPGREGQNGQHIVSTRSSDQGRTWSELVDIEPSDGPNASWVVPLLTSTGRVYGFYTYNGDDVHTLNDKPIRADVIGHYAYKYSDDGGRTWSKQRYRLPLRITACDRGNDWRGRVQIFWGIDKPMVTDAGAMFAFTKLGKFMLEQGEGWLFFSDNILTEPDPEKLHWQLLPDGEHGLRGPTFGSVQEEHNVVTLDDGSLYCVWRTTLGHPCCAYSRDNGHTWSEPEPMTHAPGGRILKTPRACPKLWRTADGKFLFWFHNHAAKSYHGRNPAWIAGGIEKDGRIEWSEPEILLYSPDPDERMSYPDLIEQDGHVWVTETNKTIARVHEIDRSLLEGLWAQGQCKTVARRGLLAEADSDELRAKAIQIPEPVNLEKTGGMAIDLWLRLESLEPGQVLVESPNPRPDDGSDSGPGLQLTTAENGTLRIRLDDGKTRAEWDSDPKMLAPDRLHHVVVIVDAGPRIIQFVIDGVLNDGGSHRERGWGRYESPLGQVVDAGKMQLAPSLEGKGEIRHIRLYRRYLRISEAVANFHAGPEL